MKLQCEIAMYRRWKQRQATKNEFRNIFCACKDNTNKAKVYSKLTPVGVIKGDKNPLYKKNKQGNCWDLCYMGYVTASPNMAELINVFFASVLSNKISQASLFRKKVQE